MIDQNSRDFLCEWDGGLSAAADRLRSFVNFAWVRYMLLDRRYTQLQIDPANGAERDRLFARAARRGSAEARINHGGKLGNLSVYGQDQWAWGAHWRRAKRARRVRLRRKQPNQGNSTNYKLAKMNIAMGGFSANLGDVPADTFFEDQHPDLKADYIMALPSAAARSYPRSQTADHPTGRINPPFNLKDWRGPDELVHDGRWNGYETPPTGNANYAWILHMVSNLSGHGVAGFVLANGSMSTNTTDLAA